MGAKVDHLARRNVNDAIIVEEAYPIYLDESAHNVLLPGALIISIF